MADTEIISYTIRCTQEEFRRVLSYIEWLRNPDKNKNFKKPEVPEAEEETEE